MISAKMQNAINDQIQAEFYSAYMYLSMSAYFESQNLPGMAKWLRIQFQEEQEHALKFYDFLADRGGTVELKTIEQPPLSWASPVAAFEEVLAHEQLVTSLIYKLYETALAEKDYPAQVLLQWYINEQVEEEKNASAIVEDMKRIEGRQSALLILNHSLGKRGAD